MVLGSMALTARVAVLLCLSSALSYAENWTGALVDSNCYEFRERNVNPSDTMTYVDRDTREEILYCSANAKTRTFTIVLREGPSSSCMLWEIQKRRNWCAMPARSRSLSSL